MAWLSLWVVCTSQGQVSFNAETGLIFTGYNTVGIPGTTGTKISLKEDLNSHPQIYYRLKADYFFKERHKISLLVAPLTVDYKGSLPYTVFFANEVFPAHTNLNATYKFNSYRFTYCYYLLKSPTIDIGLGITAKIRDAKIAMESSSSYGELIDLGGVPLIYFTIWWRCNDKFGILVDGDALAVKFGRAEDVLIASTYKYSDRLVFKAGYRILEGGSDGSTVYTFALFHYASLGVSVNF